MVKAKKLEVKKSKTIYNNTTVLDRNFIENPLFACNLKEELSTIKKIEDSGDLSTEAKTVVKMLSQNQNKETLSVIYRVWNDSRGDKKELLIANSFPNFQTQDVWNGLIGLYLKKITPISYNNDENSFPIEYDTMEFSLYELAKFMNKSIGGKTFEMLDMEILRLQNAVYHTFSSNIIFDKKEDKYLNTDRNGISFISNYYKSKRKNLKNGEVTDKCSIQFNRVIIDNIRYEYFKYMNPNIYFSLPSRGVTRRLYTYLIGASNSFNNENVAYIKRSIYVLANKLPIYPQVRSKIKEKMNIGLKYLKENNIISDYFYGDEVVVNGIKEDVIYFITKGNKNDVIEEISFKQIELEINTEKSNFEIPENIGKELLRLGVTQDKTYELIKSHDKWKIVKYILWIDEESKKLKQKPTGNPAGMLIFAIESGQVNLELSHKHIIDFVDQEKEKSKKKKELTENTIKKLYDEYLKEEFKKFKLEDEFGYSILHSNILVSLNLQVENRISQMKLLLSNSENEDEIKKYQEKIDELEEFKEKQENSSLFIKGFTKESIMYRQLKSFDDFKRECMGK